MSEEIPRPQAARAMMEASRFFHQQGWLLGTCGNLSVQLKPAPRRLLVTPSGKDKGRLEEQDFLLVDEVGQNLESQGLASAELGVHLGIYARTSARAIYHVHSIANNLASRLWRKEGCVRFTEMEMIKGLRGRGLRDEVELPIVENSPDMAELAEFVWAGMRPDVPGVLVYQHGIYAWGDSPDEARRHIEILEFLCSYRVELERLEGKR